MKKRLFVDMDGTLAVFHPLIHIETLYQEGYFLNLEPGGIIGITAQTHGATCYAAPMRNARASITTIRKGISRKTVMTQDKISKRKLKLTQRKRKLVV